MKSTLQGIEEWTGHKSPDPSPWKGIGALVLLILAMIAVMFLNSCATLNSIPWSLSYQDRAGETFTITKGSVPIVRPEK